MAILRVQVDGHTLDDFELPRVVGSKVRLGSGDENELRIQHDSVPQRAALVMRSNNGFFVFIPEPGTKAMRNGEPVFWLSVLRNEDVVQVGQAEIIYLEIGVERLEAGSMWIGTECSFCLLEFKERDRVIYCPKCETPYHYEPCWSRDLQGETCPRPGCGYAIDQTKPYTENEQR